MTKKLEDYSENEIKLGEFQIVVDYLRNALGPDYFNKLLLDALPEKAPEPAPEEKKK